MGTVIYMNCPTAAFAGRWVPQPTALEMRIDLLKAQIRAETEAQYNPTEIEYQRRLRENGPVQASAPTMLSAALIVAALIAVVWGIQQMVRQWRSS